MTTLPTNIAAGSTGHWTHSNLLHADHNKGQFAWTGHEGTLVVANGVMHFSFPFACELLGLHARVSTSPTGQAAIIDVLKGINGGGAPSTIYTNQANRLTIASGAKTSGPMVTPDVVAMGQYDYLVFDIKQIGSIVAGANLTVCINWILG